MSWNPENEKGWNEECKCPHCGCSIVEYTGLTEIRHGETASYEVTEGECVDCGRKVKIVDIIRTEMCGVFDGEGEE